MKRSTFTTKLNTISRLKMVPKKLMNLSFYDKSFGRSVPLNSSFGKTFSYVRDACKYKDKVYQADMYRKNNTCTCCVFNGFKYIYYLE